MKTLGMTFLAVILPAFGQEPTYKAAQGFGFTNAMLTLGGTNQIQTESELFMAESLATCFTRYGTCSTRFQERACIWL